LENLKASLRTTYKLVAKANKMKHQRKKEIYDRKAQAHSFEVNDLVYLYTPVTKASISLKFRQVWAGPYQITKKIYELNYKFVDKANKKQFVHVIRLKSPQPVSLEQSTETESSRSSKTNSRLFRFQRGRLN